MIDIITDTHQDICELADFISSEYFSSGVVMPESILMDEGVRVVYGDFKKAFDGLLEWRNNRFYTYCNLNSVYDKSTPRVRFTLAHETGHYFIDHHRNALKQGLVPAHPSFCGYRSKSIIEREADAFASHLLMPTPRFLKDAKCSTIGFEGIRKLSDKYKTSLTSTTIRYMDVFLENAVLLCWDKNRNLLWRRCSENSDFSERNVASVNFSSLAKSSATEKLLSGNVTNRNDIVETGSVASSWFYGINSGWSTDAILIEQAVHRGKYGWLTLLWPV